MYSWQGPGSAWVRRTDLPEHTQYHTVVYDAAHRAIWLYAARSTIVYMFSLDNKTWQTVQPLRQWWGDTDSVLCGHYIITPGGAIHSAASIGTTRILITDTRTGKTVISNTRLQYIVRWQSVTRVTPIRL